MQIKGELTEILVELTTGEKILVVQIAIDCESCGRLQYAIPGHHLKLLRDMITRTIDAHADLSGGTITAGERTTMVVPGSPKDPTVN